MPSTEKTNTSPTTTTPASQMAGPQAMQKKAVGVIQKQETPEPDHEQESFPAQLKENKTGMPDQLKSGIESLSGMSMDHVKVHYNSSQPAQLNALAYAQGSDIHVGPGQEKHLPHEAWHVVQQAQGRVQATRQMRQAVPVNEDPGLEHEADVMGEKAMQLKSDIRQFPSAVKNIAQEQHASVFQMKPRKAMVKWGVTHLVKAQGESLFGSMEEDGWKDNELPVEEGELRQGQLLMVDDELVFMSRRGSNQEDAEKRKSDSKKELKQQWNKVLAVNKTNYEGKDVFIRFETIQWIDEPQKKEKRNIGKVEIPEKDVLGEEITKQLHVIKDAWIEASLKRRRSIDQVKYKEKESVDKQEDDELDEEEVGGLPQGLTSGWNWDQYDEGEDVATEMAIPLYRSYELKNKPTNFMLKAYYEDEGEDVPITFLMMEATSKENRLFRDDFKYDPSEPQFFYIRWLVGNPVKKGGGSELMALAKQKAFEYQYAIYVQVAYSAIKFYTDSGFEVAESGAFKEGEGYGDTLLKFTPPKF